MSADLIVPMQEIPAPCRGCGGAGMDRVLPSGQRWSSILCAACSAKAERERVERETAAMSETIRLRIERNYGLLDVPPLYADASLQSFVLHGSDADREAQGRVLQLARRYLGEWPGVPSVVTCAGKPGRGKGHIVWAIARAVVLECNATARVAKLGDVIRDLRAAWDRQGGASEVDRLALYRAPDLLVVDEVSRHAFYGQPQQHLYDLVDWRLEHNRPTILTTNEDRSGLLDLVGPALMSRCLAAGGYWEFGGPDYRVARGRT